LAQGVVEPVREPDERQRLPGLHRVARDLGDEATISRAVRLGIRLLN
jgi:hypothetical protein